VDHEIRVAAYRRCEVCVGARGETEVAFVGGRVASLRETPQRRHLEKRLLGLSPHGVQEALEVDRSDIPLWKREIELRRERAEVLQLLAVGCFMDSVQGRNSLTDGPGGDRLVRGDHQILDQLVGL
jgi:hypothetical protein